MTFRVCWIRRQCDTAWKKLAVFIYVREKLFFECLQFNSHVLHEAMVGKESELVPLKYRIIQTAWMIQTRKDATYTFIYINEHGPLIHERMWISWVGFTSCTPERIILEFGYVIYHMKDIQWISITDITVRKFIELRRLAAEQFCTVKKWEWESLGKWFNI